jgi:signal transduction histidine kinase
MVPSLSSEKSSSRSKVILLKFVFSTTLAFLLCQVNLDYVESFLFDIRMRMNPVKAEPGPFELIYIRPETIEKYRGYPSAIIQNNLLQKLIDAGASHIVYDFDFKEVPGETKEKIRWEETLTKNAKVFVVGRGAPIKGKENLQQLGPPFERVKTTPGPKTADISNFAKDGVSRRAMLTYQETPLLPLIIARDLNPDLHSLENVRGRFDFYGTDQTFIDYLPSKSYPTSSFEDLIADSADFSRFKNKIVILGTDLGLSETEYLKTPYSREIVAMTLAEVNANTIDSLVRNSGPHRAPVFVSWILTFIASFLAMHVVLALRPARGLTILILVIGGFIVFNFITFWAFRLWLPMATPLISVFLCYYFFIPYRLIVENRRSWEYFQKNKLLKQVEELKANFISMMSHDLKTPIARIQGMTDIILSDAVTLSSQQREAVDTIKHSSDDLLKFINAILDYGKIESQGVQLQLQSKDVNNLLEEVIRKHEFLAKVKHIQIVSELEPMFPIPVDADLIKVVFSNLVENAIKYSPETTKILISSEEKDCTVVIQLADQGPGIPADELSNIFMKFVRSNHAKSSPIKGSGLGLYLAKYFTELHHGSILVESSHGNGSTFTVELPIEQGGAHA